MTVTIQVAPHQATEVVLPNLDRQAACGSSIAGKVTHSRQLLKTVYESKGAQDKRSKLGEILDQSMKYQVEQQVAPRGNGLVHTCIMAYNSHHHLTLRPDDVWIAIITQFSFYVNQHAEKMRAFFVSHEGKKDLVIKSLSLSANLIDIMREMADLIQKNVRDEELQEWIMPAFSTTTEVDRTVCRTVMMGTMKKYFNYGCQLMCGIPSVTLKGNESDWNLILQRLSKSKLFGPDYPELQDWKKLLTPVIQNMIDCFRAPQPTEAAVDFWSKIVRYKSFGSGSDHLSDWITAFCLFSADGKKQDFQAADEASLTLELEERDEAGSATHATYPTIKIDDVPPAWCEIEVKIIIELPMPQQFDALMVAGLVGFAAFKSQAGTQLTADAVQPWPAWWFVQTRPQRT